jgi:L,D-peptidoglycan transpeptidase YkuD (ErfK/YbiS/YcfS/YnhG family)
MTRWIVQQSDANKPRGVLVANGKRYECVLGSEGCLAADDKVEGDGKTPLGHFPIRYAYYRADRMERPASDLDLIALSPEMGWCDDVGHSDYNKAIIKPFDASHENLWREDHVYDLIIVIGHNDDPVVVNRGSAVFIHIAREGYIPTRGCIALAKSDLIEVLASMKSGDTIEIVGAR